MAQVAFDTLKFVKRLELAGVPAQQAEAFSEAVRESHEVADVATKADIAEVKRDIADVRRDLHSEVTNVRKDLQLEMAGIRSEQKLMRWMLGAIIAGIVSLIIKAFFVAAV